LNIKVPKYYGHSSYHITDLLLNSGVLTVNIIVKIAMNILPYHDNI